MNKLKIAACVIAVCLVAFGTWWATSTWYEKEIAQARADAIEAGRRIERADATKTIEVMNERYLALKEENKRATGERDAARRIADRLRKSASAGNVSGKDGDPCRASKAELAECRSFLAEGVELLQEAREGWRETARERDALIEITRPF